MQSYKARGTINPSRFVVASGEQDSCVNQAGANSVVVGISQEWNQDAPIPGAGTDAATSGELVKVYDINETCWLELGATVARGDRLKSDANGQGTPIATTGTTPQQIGARALQAGTSGQLVRVQVLFSTESPA